jgi:hypothetical protein
MKVKFYELEMYGETYKVYLAKGNYSNNGSIAVEIIAVDSEGFEEPFASLTRNIPCEYGLANDAMQFIDTNNLGDDIANWLVKNNIAKFTGLGWPSGYRMYPLYEFKNEALAGMRDM